jgi:hypothetical protein
MDSIGRCSQRRNCHGNPQTIGRKSHFAKLLVVIGKPGYHPELTTEMQMAGQDKYDCQTLLTGAFG